MSKLKPVHILIIVAVIIVLGAAAWSVGWAARRLVGPNAAPTPTAIEIATATEQSAPTAIPATATTTAAPSTPSPVADYTPQATSTKLVPTATPTEEWETVRSGEGLYQVCRRHCQGKWLQEDVPPSLERYAQETAEHNNLSWPNPPLSTGQKLQMPPCPGG